MKIYNYRIRKKEKQRKNKLGIIKNLVGSFFILKKPKNFLTLIFRLFSLGVLLIALLFLYYAKDLPNPNKLLDREVAESTKIFDRNGELLYEIHGEAKRTLVSLEQIPDYAKKATIAIEDKNFYNHHGLYFKGIIRSIFRYIINFGPEGGGGSTLTQQFVKNAILTNKKSFSRKIPEAILSLSIEAKFSKDEILKLYLNEIPYGRNAYGIEAASESYFAKNSKDLSLAESAYLAALPQAPTFYNPLGPNRASLDARKNRVLTNMKEQGYISEEEEKKAKEEKVEFIKTKTAIFAPHFVLMVQDYLAKKYGEKTLQAGGLKVYTTLDLKLQKIAEKIIKENVEKNSKNYNAHNAGLVAINPKNGDILAMVGSKDYFAPSFPEGCVSGKTCLFEPNVNVSLSQLQPGSSFKPFVYVTAFGQDYKLSPSTVLLDVETVFGVANGKDWAPKNYDGKERGPVSIRQALAGSLNIPAVKTLAIVGVEKAVQVARDIGITSPMSDCGLSLVLGGCEVRLLDHVSAYSVLANGGIKNEKTSILKILDKDGNILEEQILNPKKILDPRSVYQLTNIMTDDNARAYVFGANSKLTLPDRPVAAKTGTTQDWHDGWTLGFTPSLAVGVWTGNNDGTLMKKGADGVYTAAPIWNQFMKEALTGTPTEIFTEPEGIIKTYVDTMSGKLPTALSPETKMEIFADYNQPTEFDNIHISIAYDSSTNQPATTTTLPEKIIYKTFTVLHSEKPENPNWEEPVKVWAEKNGYTYPNDYIQDELSKPNNQTDFKVIYPEEGEIISSPTFFIKTQNYSQQNIVRVDVLIDGQFYKSYKENFGQLLIDKNFSNGNHNIVIKTIFIDNSQSETNIPIIFGSEDVFSFVEPKNHTIAIFPITLKVKSGKKYEFVNFFKSANDTLTPIGKAEKVEIIGGEYYYSLMWNTPPEEKVFYIIAESSDKTTSQKIRISLP